MTNKEDRHDRPKLWWRSRLLLLSLGILSVTLLILVWFAASSYGGYEETFLSGQTVELRDGWADAAGNRVSLPAKLPYSPEGYQLTLTLGLQEDAPKSLLFSAKYLNVRILLDGREIGSCMCRPAGENRTLGKDFLLLPLTGELEGRTLRIEAEPLLGAGSQYEITAPRIGSSGLLIYEIVRGELPLLLVIAAIFCFGIFLLICGIQTIWLSGSLREARTYHANFIPIGLFAIIFSVYSLTITSTVYLFVSNFYLIYLMEFLLLAFLPLPLLVQAATVCAPRFKKFLLADCCVICLNACIQTSLHFFAGVELRNTVVITHAVMVVSIALLIPALTIDSYRGKGWWWLPLSFSPILAGALTDIFRYYLPGAYQKAADFQFGVLLFLLLQTAYLFRTNILYYESYLKSSVYQQMAYTDALTGLDNRAAFEEKLTEVRGKLGSYSAIWCLCADINNLKHANDTFGHAQGDELIKGAAYSLQAAVEKPCETYRIGGDEFVILLFNQSEQAVAETKVRFNGALEQYNRTHDVGLSVALGCDRFGFTNGDTIERLVSRADTMMYEDKRAWKDAHQHV